VQEKLCATRLFDDKVQPFVAMLSVLPLEHVPEKWKPVFRKGHATQRDLEHCPILLNREML
jgi:hypothetical protein